MTPGSRVGNALGILVCLAGVAACEDPAQGYVAAADLTRHGFVRDQSVARRLDGRTIRVWGFVDHANLYGDRGTREILGDWSGGEASEPDTWRFGLKAHPNGKVGHSFAVKVRSDPDRRGLLSAMVADARAGRATRVYVTGTMRTFRAPANAVALTGMYLEVDASSGVLLGRRPVP